MIEDGLDAFKDKEVLLLQGPVGPFFRRFSKALSLAGARGVHKINFNGGDFLFYPRHATEYTGALSDWSDYLERFIGANKVDIIFLFGDCRPVHQIAHKIAKKMGVEVGVFEEGYIRPDFITLERDGVNGRSSIPKDSSFYLKRAVSSLSAPARLGNTYWYMVLWAMMYYLASAFLRPLFFRYQHHRPLSVLESLPWLRGIVRKQYYKFKERKVEQELFVNQHKKYFLVPLQVHNDSQIREHSNFASVSEFITSVVESFACHAPCDVQLVIKHHPMDRAYHDYTLKIKKLSEACGVQSRVKYIHDQHLPKLLHSALGVVVVNSTVGLSAVLRGLPVFVAGESIYKIDRMVYDGGLHQFWNDAEDFKPDSELVKRYADYLIDKTQINGSFYKGRVVF